MAVFFEDVVKVATAGDGTTHSAPRSSSSFGKISAQVSFRLQIARAALRVDVAPSPHGILQHAAGGRGDGLPRRWGVDQGGCGGQGHAQGLRPGLQTSGARQGEGQRQGQGEEHCGLQVLPLGIRLQEGAGVRLCP